MEQHIFTRGHGFDAVTVTSSKNFVWIHLLVWEKTKQKISHKVVRQPLPGLPREMPGYSIGLISVRQTEPGLRRVTPLALAA